MNTARKCIVASLSTTPWARRWLRLGIIGLFGLPLARILAHEYPKVVDVVVGQSKTFWVADSFGCPAYMSANVTGTALVTLDHSDDYGVIVAYTITAGNTLGQTAITVQWIGEDAFAGTDGPCQENTAPGGRLIMVNVIPEPTPDSTANNPSSGRSGDPVNLFNGELYFHEPPDLSLGGPMNLRFERYYASRLRRNFVYGAMGDNWRHNFEWRVHWNGTVLWVVTNEGKVLKYLKQNEVWVLRTPTDNPLLVEQMDREILVGDARSNLVYRFDAYGKLEEIHDRGDKKLIFVYDSSDRLSSVRDDENYANARRIEFGYTSGKLTFVYEYHGFVSGRILSYSYSGDNLVSHTSPTATTTSYVYDTDHAEHGLLKWVQRPLGNIPWKQTWDEVGKVTTQTDAYNNVTSYDYGPPESPGTTVVTDALNNDWTYVHNADGTLVSVMGPDNQITSLSATATRLHNQVTSPKGTSISRTFLQANGNVTTETDENGFTVTQAYQSIVDSDGIAHQHLASVTYPDTTSDSFTRDADGNVLTHTTRGGEMWTFTYNSLGQVLTETSPLGGLTTRTYDSRHNLATITDPAGKVTTYTYDSKQRLERITWHDGKQRNFEYDNLNRLAARQDENGYVIVTTYDSNGNSTSVRDRRNLTTYYNFDLMDRLTSVTLPVGNGFEFTYDALGRLATMTSPSANITTYTYDARGNVVNVSDSLGTIETLTYDGGNEVTSVTDAIGRTTLFTRDDAGRLTQVTLPDGQLAKAAYNSMDQPTSATIGGVSSITSYDSHGFPTSVALPGGMVKSAFTLNALGQITQATDGNSQPWLFQRDNQGRLTSLVDPANNTRTFSYDSRNRITGVTFPSTLGNVSYTYDEVGRVTQASFSDSVVQDFTYDEAGNLLTANGLTMTYDEKGRAIECNGLSTILDLSRRIIRLTYASGKYIDYEYDVRDRVTKVTDWLGAETTFIYDALNRVTRIDRPNGLSTMYTYDNQGGVTAIEEKKSGNQIALLELSYDDRGMILTSSRTGPTGVPSFSPSQSDQQWTYTSDSQISTFTHDALGRLANDGTRTYNWNLAFHLQSYSQASDTVTFGYDAEGNRITRDDGSVAHHYVWNYLFERPSIAAIQNASAADLQINVCTPDGELLYTVNTDNSRHFHHFDEAGNTLFLTDDAGDVLASYRYTAYGELIADSSGGAISNDFTWQGRYSVMREGSSGLYYMRARYYDSTKGRFISRDPVMTMSPLFFNPYQYAGGNPLLFRDPTGNEVTKADVASGAANGLAAGLGDVSASRAGVVTRTAEKLERIAQAAGTGKSAEQIARSAERVRGTGKLLDRVGYGAAVFSAGLEANDLNNRLSDLRKGVRDREATLVGTAQRLGQDAMALYRAKRITLAELEQLLRNIDTALIEQLKANSDIGFVDTALESTKSLLKSVAGIAPIPGGVWDSYFDWLSK